MAGIKIANLFEYRNVSPSSLMPGNLIYFKYKSPNGVHDRAPLVYVLSKEFDRIYGINVHYDMDELQDIVDVVETKVNTFFEQQWYSKHPEKKQELYKQRLEFNPGMIDKKEFLEMKRRVNKIDLERFPITVNNSEALRCYLYQRMNNVSKLVWKL
jgi:hypothetical protein